jgi:UDP-N-acetylmuramyl pentapeptide phosphotransferase/UDP-N-acetylglucosamine-1-phosphate transferase
MDGVGAWVKGPSKGVGVDRIRGIVMLLAAALAMWKGWQIHRGEAAVLAYLLGVLALAMGVWDLRRKAPPPRV